MVLDMELEAVLRAPEVYQAPYPPKVITLANGKKMVIRRASRLVSSPRPKRVLHHRADRWHPGGHCEWPHDE